MKNYTIKMEIKGGKVICTPDPIRLKHNDNVDWKCGKKTFTVYFGLKSPIVKEKIDGIKGKTEVFDIRANATAAGYSLEFKYTVAVLYKNKIIVTDPTIIIDP